MCIRDRGTATFSDIANGISEDYGHWLGDAFASGGSQGYDHKGMGITAKGAWESVKRHFRETGTDIQKQDFTVIGVGDMSGDVFGNGMLLSKHIKLVGAFNHMHIFVDPDPDPAKSLAERQRMFRLPRSAWTDYDKKLISPGGAIYERSAKSLRLSPEARALFEVPKDQVTPNELLSYMLKSQIDLLWFGILLAKFLEIGMITPPIGLNVFVIKSVVGDQITTGKVFRGIMWFLLADLIVVLLLIMFPSIITWLPSVMR